MTNFWQDKIITFIMHFDIGCVNYVVVLLLACITTASLSMPIIIESDKGRAPLSLLKEISN